MIFIEDGGPGSCDGVRNAVFRYLGAHNVPADVASEALCHCLAAIRDAGQVGGLAAELGLEVAGPRSNEHMALYWDVTRDGRAMGFIYRGWDDPGFGVGECVPVSADEMPVLMAQVDAVTRLLATNGVALTITPLSAGGCWLDMTTVIYSDGFNAGTLRATLGTVAKCAATVRSMVE